MGLRVFLATALMLLTSLAFAEHAISLDAETPPTPQATTPPIQATDPSPATAEQAPAAAPVKAAFPSQMNITLVQTGRREVCDTFDFGGGDVRTECRIGPLPIRAENPALRGICITRHGNRTCY